MTRTEEIKDGMLMLMLSVIIFTFYLIQRLFKTIGDVIYG